MRLITKTAMTAVLLTGFTQAALADNRTPADMAETIAPAYRSGDMQSATGEKFVWVTRIEGRDSEGRTQVLFNDAQGALLPMKQLVQANKLINPTRIEKKGEYQNLKLKLADNTLTVSQNGLQRKPLPQGMSEVALHGQVEVSKFEVSANNLSLQLPEAHKLALLK